MNVVNLERMKILDLRSKATNIMKLKPCPFCDTKAPDDLIDNLYPSGIYFRYVEGIGTTYLSHKEATPNDFKMYKYVCPCCDVEMTGHSIEEVISKWNRRPQ